MRAPALSAVLLLAFVGALSASAACSNQGEGEFCNTSNGNNDCQDGLECKAAPGVPSGAVNADRCCPIPPAQPTTAVCSQPAGVGTDASTEVGDVFSAPVPDAEAGSAPETSAVPVPDAAPEAEAGGMPEASAVPGREAGSADAASADALPE